MKLFRWHHGFTLVEIIVVIAIMGVMAVLAGPKLTAMVTRSRIRTAVNNMMAIHAAQQVYQARNGAYVATAVNCTSADCSNLNATLGLNIVPDTSTTYACTVTACTATGSGTTFLVTATLGASLNSDKTSGAAYNPACQAPSTATPPCADCP